MPARVTRESVLTGTTRTMQIKLYEQEEFDNRWIAYKQGFYPTLQDAFPLLSNKAIEFLRNGTLPNEWDENV